ncbi:hypothetical protein O9557_09930 [Achromobacter ruhlandii]|nr:hypothetical protein [Achromobacter ruhlandii]MCZ8396236.1 hypothetical protein [Achromobacter ruhlandii]
MRHQLASGLHAILQRLWIAAELMVVAAIHVRRAKPRPPILVAFVGLVVLQGKRIPARVIDTDRRQHRAGRDRRRAEHAGPFVVRQRGQRMRHRRPVQPRRGRGVPQHAPAHRSRRREALGLFQEIVEHQQPALARQRGVESRFPRQRGQIELPKERQRKRRFHRIRPGAGIRAETLALRRRHPRSFFLRVRQQALGLLAMAGGALVRVRIGRPRRPGHAARQVRASADLAGAQGDRVLLAGGGRQHQRGTRLFQQSGDHAGWQIGGVERTAQGVLVRRQRGEVHDGKSSWGAARWRQCGGRRRRMHHSRTAP